MNRLKYIIIALIMLAINHKSYSQNAGFEILDHNRDGILNPYEALDILFTMQENSNGEINMKDIDKTIATHQKEMQAEADDIMKELDKNKNGMVEYQEVEDEEFLYFLRMMDSDKNESVTKKEILDFNFEEAFFLSDKDLKKEIKMIFKEYATTDNIVVEKLHDSVKIEMEEWDLNRDGQISQEETFEYMKANNMPAIFNVKDDVAYMTGVIGASTPARVLELIYEHPEVKTIEMIHVPGSIDDVSNLRASMYVHRFGLDIRLNPSSIIASGGTDFFLAGKERTVAVGAKIGVHSWGGGAKPATELPKNHKSHKKYLEYYRAIDIPEEFYWYTLEAAPASDIHFMTEEEIIKYKVRTKE